MKTSDDRATVSLSTKGYKLKVLQRRSTAEALILDLHPLFQPSGFSKDSSNPLFHERIFHEMLTWIFENPKYRIDEVIQELYGRKIFKGIGSLVANVCRVE